MSIVELRYLDLEEKKLFIQLCCVLGAVHSANALSGLLAIPTTFRPRTRYIYNTWMRPPDCSLCGVSLTIRANLVRMEASCDERVAEACRIHVRRLIEKGCILTKPLSYEKAWQPDIRTATLSKVLLFDAD